MKKELDKIRGLIAKNSFDEVWIHTRNFISEYELINYLDEVIKLERRWNDIQTEKIRGTANNEQIQLLQNQLANSCLILLKKIESPIIPNIKENSNSETIYGTQKKKQGINTAILVAIIGAVATISVAIITNMSGYFQKLPEIYTYKIVLFDDQNESIKWDQKMPRLKITFIEEELSYPIIDGQVSFNRTAVFGNNPVSLFLENGHPYLLCENRHKLKEGQVNRITLCKNDQRVDPSNSNSSYYSDRDKGRTTETGFENDGSIKESKVLKEESVAPLVKQPFTHAFVAIVCTGAESVELDGKRVIPISASRGDIAFLTNPGEHTITIWGHFNKVLLENQKLNIPADSVRISGCNGELQMQRIADFRSRFNR